MLIFPFIMFVSSDPTEKKIKPYFYQSQPSPFSFLPALFYFIFLSLPLLNRAAFSCVLIAL